LKSKQLAPAKTLLQMRRTVEDIEDARTIERAKRANGSKPRIPWAQVKKESQLDRLAIHFDNHKASVKTSILRRSSVGKI
jgi:hypothetical protein